MDSDKWEALREAAQRALGKTPEHVYQGMCPDPVNGPDSRDPECFSCLADPQAVLALLAELDALAAQLTELRAAMDEQGVMALIEFGKQVTAVASGAKNYVTSNMEDAEGNVLAFLTIQAADGKNPAEMRDEAICERDEARAEAASLRAEVERREHARGLFFDTLHSVYNNASSGWPEADAYRDGLDRAEEIAEEAFGDRPH